MHSLCLAFCRCFSSFLWDSDSCCISFPFINSHLCIRFLSLPLLIGIQQIPALDYYKYCCQELSRTCRWWKYVIISVGSVSRNRISESQGIYIFSLIDTAQKFPRWLYQLTCPQQYLKIQVLHILINTWTVCLFLLNHSCACIVLEYYAFNLHFSWVSLQVYNFLRYYYFVCLLAIMMCSFVICFQDFCFFLYV